MQHPSARRGRYRQIASILTRHGLGYLVGVVGLERFVPFHRGLLGHPRRAQPYTRPEHLRMALEELGPAFVKLGQILSTRADLLPPAYQAEFAKLQDAAPPVASAAIQGTLVAALGRPLDAALASFDPAPLAAASIGQAHAATLPDGTDVVVKVRRPGVVAEVEQDLEILESLAVAASHRSELAQQYDVVALAREFGETLRSELDYVREGHSAERFAANFAHDPSVHIPRVYWDLTTPQIITLERIRGIKVNDLAALEAGGIGRRALAERAARAMLQMVFEDGFFHADPHPGNFFIESDGRIGIIDFGMVGTVDERTQRQLVGLLLAITSRDPDRLVDAFLELGAARQRVDRVLLRQDLQRLVARYYEHPLGEIALAPLVEDALAIVRRHHLQLPVNLALLLKTAVMSEGMAAQLDPDFRLTAVLTPYAERLVLRHFSPFVWGRRLGQAGLDAAQLGVDMPRQLRRLLDDLDRGHLEVGMRPVGVEELMERIERLANGVVLSIVLAAVINGLAVLMTVYHPAGSARWSGVAFTAGLVLAAVLVVALVWRLVSGSRRRQ